MRKRVFGLETEYGAFSPDGWHTTAVDQLYSAFQGRHTEFLPNGGRLYQDSGAHPEYASPECADPLEMVRYDKAGELIVQRHLPGLILFKNNVARARSRRHGSGEVTYACHENYLVRADKYERILQDIVPFLVTRQIYAGAGSVVPVKYCTSCSPGVDHGGVGVGTEHVATVGGRLSESHGDGAGNVVGVGRQTSESHGHGAGNVAGVGRHSRCPPGADCGGTGVGTGNAVAAGRHMSGACGGGADAGTGSAIERQFHISQRARFIDSVYDQCSKPIICQRDEHWADRRKYNRLQIHVGDSNMSEVATYLKVGATSLVLDLIEEGAVDPTMLAEPVKALQSISSDPKRRWLVSTRAKGTMPALEIQREYLGAAEKYLSGNAQTDAVLKRWRDVLDKLERDPEQLVGKVDWVTKKFLIDSYLATKPRGSPERLAREIDLRYHDISREKGLYCMLQNRGLTERLTDDASIARAMNIPPSDTRAWFRGNAVRMLADKCAGDYSISWDDVRLTTTGTRFHLRSPRKIYAGWLAELREFLGNSKAGPTSRT